ncbi:hypothetical protein NKDENANG_00950 [Candidatus Entotheonellaceae bacterium PAL068K]
MAADGYDDITALPLCFIVIFVTEMLMGGGGLDDSLMYAQGFADSEGVFVGLDLNVEMSYTSCRGSAPPSLFEE